MTVSQIVFVSLALLFSIMIITKTIKRKLFEKESLIWLLLMVVVIIFGISPNLIITLANWVGIDYPPSLLFLLSILFLLILVFRLTTQITALNSRIKELGQQIAIINEKLEKRNEQ
jgi:Uncharacterized conserved protein